MNWTVTAPTTLYGSNVDPAQLGQPNLGGALGMQLPKGAVVSSANPPNTVAGFLQATYNGQTGWVSTSALSQNTLMSEAVGIGLFGLALYGLYFLARRL